MIVAETGADMSRFPTPGQLCAWAGVAPASYESAGKRRPAGTRQGSHWLRRPSSRQLAPRRARRAATSRPSTPAIARRRGPNKAAVAVANSMLVTLAPAHHRQLYEDPGADYFERRHDPAVEAKRLQRRIEALGFEVSVTANVS